MKEGLDRRVSLISQISIALEEASRDLPRQALKLQRDIEHAAGFKRTLASRASRFKK